MLKIRLKRLGAKKAPTYRVIVINSTTKREGKPIEELGYYNPKTKEMKLNKESALAWISKGAQPTDTVKYLITNCNEDGTLNYKKSEVVKLSKKLRLKRLKKKQEKQKKQLKLLRKLQLRLKKLYQLNSINIFIKNTFHMEGVFYVKICKDNCINRQFLIV